MEETIKRIQGHKVINLLSIIHAIRSNRLVTIFIFVCFLKQGVVGIMVVNNDGKMMTNDRKTTASVLIGSKLFDF